LWWRTWRPPVCWWSRRWSDREFRHSSENDDSDDRTIVGKIGGLIGVDRRIAVSRNRHGGRSPCRRPLCYSILCRIVRNHDCGRCDRRTWRIRSGRTGCWLVQSSTIGIEMRTETTIVPSWGPVSGPSDSAGVAYAAQVKGRHSRRTTCLDDDGATTAVSWTNRSLSRVRYRDLISGRCRWDGRCHYRNVAAVEVRGMVGGKPT
jgi:hypothetical protein